MLPSAGRVDRAPRDRSARRRQPRRRRAGRATLVSERLYVAGLVVPAVALLIALVGLHAPAGIDLAPDAPPTFNADRALTLAGAIADVPDRSAGSETAPLAADVVTAGLRRRRRAARRSTPSRAPGRDGDPVTMSNIVSILKGESNEAIVGARAPRQRAAGRRRGQQRARDGRRGRAGGGVRRSAQRPDAGARLGRRRRCRRRRGAAAAGAPAARAESGRGDRACRASRRRGRSRSPTAATVATGRRPASPRASTTCWRPPAAARSCGRASCTSWPSCSCRRGCPAGRRRSSAAASRPITIGDDPRASSDTAPDADRFTHTSQAVNDLVLALDAGAAPSGPAGSYVRTGRRVLSGWVIALLAVALLVPPGLVAVDLTARALRERLPLRDELLRVVRLGVPLAGAALGALVAGLTDVAPSSPSAATLPRRRERRRRRRCAARDRRLRHRLRGQPARCRPRPGRRPSIPALRAAVAITAALACGCAGAALANGGAARCGHPARAGPARLGACWSASPGAGPSCARS